MTRRILFIPIPHYPTLCKYRAIRSEGRIRVLWTLSTSFLPSHHFLLLVTGSLGSEKSREFFAVFLKFNPWNAKLPSRLNEKRRQIPSRRLEAKQQTRDAERKQKKPELRRKS